MGKNIIGGKKHKRGKNNNNPVKRLLQIRQEGESYAKITNLLGNSRLQCHCFDIIPTKNKDKKSHEYKIVQRIGVIRGSMRKRVWIKNDDIVLVSIREYQDDKCDVIWKYTIDEIDELKIKKELPNIQINDESYNNISFTNNDLIPSDDDSYSDQDTDHNEIPVEYQKPDFNKINSKSTFEEDLDNI